MNERRIECYKCGVHVGIVRDARLMVGLKFICPVCQQVEQQVDDLMEIAMRNRKGDMPSKYNVPGWNDDKWWLK